MKINFTLTKNTGLRLTEPFNIKDDEEIILHFDTDYDMSSSKIIVRNGDVSESFEFAQDFVVPDKFLFDGRLYVTIELNTHVGKLVKRWEFMPIRISLTDSGIQLIDTLSDLEKRVLALEKYHEII